MKNDVGISPCIYLVMEVKSDKKGKDVIDSHSLLLKNFLKGLFLFCILFFLSEVPKIS